MRKETVKSIIQFLRITTITSLTLTANIPLGVIGYDAAEKLRLSEELRILNGLLCFVFAVAFALPFNNNQLDAIPRQWGIANKRGKIFIALLCITATLSAGTANSYFMIGDKSSKAISYLFKLIALILPAFAAEAIASELLLELNLALLRFIYPSKYKAPYEAANMLATIVYNLKANERFIAKLQDPQSKLSTTARSLIEAHKDITETGLSDIYGPQVKLQKAIEELKILVSNKEDNITVTSSLFRAIKYLVGGVAGAAAGYFLFIKLGPKTAECVYGSLFDFAVNSSGEIICPRKSDSGAQIGNALGYFTLFYQSVLLVYPTYALLELGCAALHNKKNALKVFTYLLIGSGAVVRASVAGFIEWFNTKDDPEWVKIGFVSLLVWLYNCFGMGIKGRSTFSILYNTYAKPVKNAVTSCYGSLSNYFKDNNQEELNQERLPLVNLNAHFSEAQARKATAGLLEQFRLRPGVFNEMLCDDAEPLSCQLSTNLV